MPQPGLKFATAATVIGGMIGAFIAGVYFGYENRPEVARVTSLINKEAPLGEVSPADFAPFWRAWKIIEEKYVATGSSTDVKTDDQAKVWGAVSGLVDSLGDPYSVFLPPEENKRFSTDLAGNFGGVGMEIGKKDDVITVIAPLPNTPAKAAGIRAGDRILEIDKKPTADMTTDEAVRLIRGEPGTKVTVLVYHDGEKNPRELILTRANITIPTIETKLLKKTTANKNLPRGVFVISLYNFSAPSADLFRHKLREFIVSGSDKMIIDLRGNPGGYLEAAVDMASWFLPKGAVVVRETYGPQGGEKLYRSLGYNVFNDKLKMVVLIDRGSASASEILAGALREHGIATLVGEKTFGKGSVQELVPVTPETSLKITIARWLTPNGRDISQNGLEPDYKVTITEADTKAGRDPQLDKAIEILTQR